MPEKMKTRSDQCSILNSHRMGIEHWELSIGQIVCFLIRDRICEKLYYGSGTGPKSGGGIRCFVAASYAEAIRKSVGSGKGRPKNMIPTGYGWLRLALTPPP